MRASPRKNTLKLAARLWKLIHKEIMIIIQRKSKAKEFYEKKSPLASHHMRFKAWCNFAECKINNFLVQFMLSIICWKPFPTSPQCTNSLRNFYWQLDLIVTKRRSYNFLYPLLFQQQSLLSLNMTPWTHKRKRYLRELLRWWRAKWIFRICYPELAPRSLIGA